MTGDEVLAHLAIQIAELRGQLVAVTVDRDNCAAEVQRLTPPPKDETPSEGGH